MTMGKHQYRALRNSVSREHLLQQGINNRLHWDEDKHEGVNWMRFSNALVNHLNEGKDFHLDDTDSSSLKAMLHHLSQAREYHKQTMIPHIKATMSKLYSESTDTTRNLMDYIHDAHKHLEANGGHHWAEKLRTLSHMNKHIDSLTKRIREMGADA